MILYAQGKDWINFLWSLQRIYYGVLSYEEEIKKYAAIKEANLEMLHNI